MSPATPPSGRAATRPDGERSRQRILDAAERLFAEHGYAGTGMTAIQRAARLPASSIYWFFRGKRELAAAVMERAADRWLDELEFQLAQRQQEGTELHGILQQGLERLDGALPLFLRLEMLLTLELEEADADFATRLEAHRQRPMQLLRGAIERSLPALDERPARELSEHLSRLALALLAGVLLSQQHGKERIPVETLAEDMEVGLDAVARHRLARESQR